MNECVHSFPQQRFGSPACWLKGAVQRLEQVDSAQDLDRLNLTTGAYWLGVARLKPFLKESRSHEEFEEVLQESVLSASWNEDALTAYPELSYPSVLLSNFSVRDDCRTLVASMDGEIIGAACFVQSKQTFLPAGFLNRVFFILSRNQAAKESLLNEIERAYLELAVAEISYVRLDPVKELSPSAKQLASHGYRKEFSLQRMARELEGIPEVKTDVSPVLRRVRWEKQDLMLFMRTWAKGFGWPSRRIEGIASGITKRLLERKPHAPDTWINFLAELDGEPVGTGAVLTYPESALVVNVSTLKQFRRRGISTQTMISLMKWCRKRGMRRMVLDVEPCEKAAMGLYRKLRYEEVGKPAPGYIRKLFKAK